MLVPDSRILLTPYKSIIYEKQREDYLMGNYRFHTPDGVIDILPQEASVKRKLETDILFFALGQLVFFFQAAKGAVRLHLLDGIVHHLQQVLLSLTHQHSYFSMCEGFIQ